MIEAAIIPGHAHVEVVVEYDSKPGKPELKGQHTLRGCARPCRLPVLAMPRPRHPRESHNWERVAILPIGLAQVSSVIITAEEGKELRKGEEISYF